MIKKIDNKFEAYQNDININDWYVFVLMFVSLGPMVAFHVELRKSIEHFLTNQILKSDHIITNIGEGYDTTTGKFTAPVDGVYSFSWTYMTRRGSTSYIGGVIDDQILVRSAIQDQSVTWMSATGHLVARMKKGSTFWTKNIQKYDAFINGYYTFLSGCKLSET